VIVFAELVSLCSGLWVYAIEEPFYPVSWYPNLSTPMLVTNTIQNTCYLSGALLSLALLGAVVLRRMSLTIGRDLQPRDVCRPPWYPLRML
jgi:hypothetical protein